MTTPSAAPGVGLSVVMPIYNGATIVPDIIIRMTPVLASLGLSCELILVDDGSRDDSWRAICEAAATAPFVRGVKLSRNFGQQVAVSAGIAKAQGKYVIVMDGDLQNPPEIIGQILERLKEGDDLVYTVSRTRNDWRTEWSSRMFWYVMTRLLRVDMVTNQLMMRGMSRRFAAIYDLYPEATRTVAGISRDIGLRTSTIEVENQRRHSGKSGYSFVKRFNLMIEIVISTTTAPLSALIYASLLVLALTTIMAIYYIANVILRDIQPGFTSLILAISFFGSITTLFIGIIGIYVANIYTEVRRRPLFLVQEETTTTVTAPVSGGD